MEYAFKKLIFNLITILIFIINKFKFKVIKFIESLGFLMFLILFNIMD